MFEVRSRRPHPALTSVVRLYSERKGFFSALSVVRPLHARPHQFLEVYLKEPYHVEDEGQGFAATPDCVLVGPCLSPGKRLGFLGELETFTIQFQPTGLSRLFGVPMTDIADQAFDAEAVLGRAVGALEAAVRRERDFEGRIAVTERWLHDRLSAARPLDAVDRVARLLARSGGRIFIEDLAARSDLSARQLQRRFLADVGATPKRYARLQRFSALLEVRRRAPERSWADLAAAFGFADQAHLIRETRSLAGRTPEALIQQLLAVPERVR
jgi:AraC-like DNA-binding protein